MLGHATKVGLLIRVGLLTKRIEGKANAINHTERDQFGFLEGKGTRDDTATLRILAGIQLVIYLEAAGKDCSGAYSGILRQQWTDS